MFNQNQQLELHVKYVTCHQNCRSIKNYKNQFKQKINMKHDQPKSTTLVARHLIPLKLLKTLKIYKYEDLNRAIK